MAAVVVFVIQRSPWIPSYLIASGRTAVDVLPLVVTMNTIQTEPYRVPVTVTELVYDCSEIYQKC